MRGCTCAVRAVVCVPSPPAMGRIAQPWCPGGGRAGRNVGIANDRHAGRATGRMATGPVTRPGIGLGHACDRPRAGQRTDGSRARTGRLLRLAPCIPALPEGTRPRHGHEISPGVACATGWLLKKPGAPCRQPGDGAAGPLPKVLPGRAVQVPPGPSVTPKACRRHPGGASRHCTSAQLSEGPGRDNALQPRLSKALFPGRARRFFHRIGP